ncbi:hypothetical protein [Nocardia carnea]|uniref:hypothetical protein n=1 Tax=Nocardia carnea TaxID=37328 RepID=UPI0002E451B0|nr:hypothetical protein [Nocardia carnea]
MQVPDYVVNPEAGVPEAAETLSAQTITMAGEAMIALVHHGTVTVVGDDGSLLAADLLDRAVRAAGARPLRHDLDLSGTPGPGWQAVLTADDCLTITAPDGSALYTGTLPTGREWRDRARHSQRRRSGIVVVGGIRGAVNDLVPAIVEDRAYWIRCPADLRHRPRTVSR